MGPGGRRFKSYRPDFPLFALVAVERGASRRESEDGCEPWDRVEAAPRAPPNSPKAANASEELLGQRDDDARRATHVAESVLVLVLGHLANQFGAMWPGTQASDSLVDALDCKHHAPQAQRVGRCDRRFDLDQLWIAKLRQLKPPVPIRGPHHHDVDLNTFEPVDAVHPRTLDRGLAFDRHAQRGEKSDRGCKVVNDDADVVQSLDRHVPSLAEAVRGGGGFHIHSEKMYLSAAMRSRRRYRPDAFAIGARSRCPQAWPEIRGLFIHLGIAVHSHGDLAFKHDPKIIEAARELRDRYVEEINTDRLLPSASGKYDVSRQLEAAPSNLKQAPLLEAA